MANVFVFADNARSTLAAPIGPSATSITLAPGTGALFPAPAAGQQFALTLNDAATRLSYEVTYCTHRSGDVLTVIRAQEGTSALSWITGDLCWNGPTSGQMAAMVQIPHMTDASIAPVFAGTSVVGNLSVTGTSQVNGVSFFGTSGVFYANPAFAGGPAIAFASDEYLQWNGSTFLLNSTGGLDVSGGNITAATGKLRANVGAYLSGDPNCATLLGDFLNSSVGSGEYFYARDPNGVIVQAYWGDSVTGSDDVIAFPNAFPNFCCQVLVCEGAPSGWGAGGDAPTILGAVVTGPTSFALYTDGWNPSAKTWGASAPVTYRYIAVGY